MDAQQLFGHGELQLQIDAVTRQLEKDTNNAALYLRRGELHRQHQDWVHATADYDRAANIDPGLAVVDLYRGKMFLDMGKFREAKTALDKYFLVEPDDSEALVTRARVLVKLGDGKAAAEDYSRAIVLAPDPQPDFYLERAQALVAEGELRSALQGLDAGIERLGPLLTLQQAALDLEIAGQDFEAALVRLQTIISRVSRKEQWLGKKGDLLLKLGRSREAAETYRQTLLAIDGLPIRLRQSPAVHQLQKGVEEALKSISAAPVTK